MKKFAISLFGCFLSSLANVSASAADLPVLKIGAVFPLSGAQSNFGNDATHGMEMALNKLRETQPELANRIIIIREDDKSNPIDAVSAAKKLLQIDKVDLIFGSLASSNTMSMAGAVVEANKPLVTPGSTGPMVTKSSDLIFRTCFSDPFQGSVVANFALTHLGKKKAAILYDHKSDYSLGLTSVFEKTFQQGGGEIVAKEAYEAGKKDFKTQIVKIRAQKPDVLFVPGYYQDVGLIMKQSRQVGYDVVMLGGDGWDSPTLFEIAGKEAVKGHYFSTHFAIDDTDPVVQNFAKSYREKFQKDPSGITALGYDGLMVIADAFRRAGSSRAEDMKKSLSDSKNVRGITGSISIDSQRDAQKDAVMLKTESDRAVFTKKILP